MGIPNGTARHTTSAGIEGVHGSAIGECGTGDHLRGQNQATRGEHPFQDVATADVRDDCLAFLEDF